MKKYLTNLTAYIVVICMLLCMLPVAYANSSTYKVVGEATLLAPPVGVKSAVAYNLVDAAGNTAVDGALLTTDGKEPQGVFVFENKLILDGSSIRSGRFNITMTGANGETASKTINVCEYRYFEDFEGQTEGADAIYYLDKLDGTGSINSKFIGTGSKNGVGQVTSDGENKFLKNPTGKWHSRVDFYYGYDSSLGKPHESHKDITLSFKLKGGPNQRFLINQYLQFFISDEGYVGIGSNDSNLSDVKISDNEWSEIRVTFDFTKSTYSLWADNNLIYENYPYNDRYKYFWDFQTFFPVDSIAVYSGSQANIDLSGNIPEKLLVGSKGVKMPIKVFAKVDGIIKEVSPAWSSSSQDVSVGNNLLTVNSNASGDVVLTATYCGISKNFNISLEEAVEDHNMAGPYTIESDTGDGIITLRGNVTGNNVSIKGLGSDISVGSCADAELCVFIDKYNKEYIIICDNKKIEKNSYTALDDIQLVADTVYVDYFGSIFDEAPILADVKIVGKPNINQSLSLDGDMYSYIYNEEECTYTSKWYIDNEIVSNNQSILISENNIGQTVCGELTVSVVNAEQTLTGAPVVSQDVVISDIYQLSEISGGARISVTGSGERMRFVVVADWINNGITQEITAKSYDGYDEDIRVDIFAPSDCAYDNVRVSLLNNDLSPFATSKLLKGTENIEKANLQEKSVLFADNKLSVYDPAQQLSSVIIFNPKGNNNFAKSYTTSDVDVDASGTILTEQICYINVLKGNAKIPVVTNKNGYHTVSVVFSDNTGLKTDFVSGAKALFENNIISTMHTDIENTDVKNEFKQIIKNCLNADSALQESILASFIKTNPSYVNTLMNGEEYDLSKLYTSILLASFLNDKNEEAALTKNLADEGYDTTAPALLTKNKNFDSSVQKVELLNGISQALTSMKETAILTGVAESVNYLETKTYLEAVEDIIVTDSMASYFTGKSYNSFSALKSALTTYNPYNPNRPGSGSASIPGSSSNAGGFVGGGSASGPVTHQPDNPQVISRFNDLAPTHWAYSDIMFLADKGIVNGLNDNSFAPERTITRAEYVKILASAFSVSSDKPSTFFNDVDKDDWFYDYVVNASKAGIIQGDGNSFKPNENITRQDAAVMLYRVLLNMNAAFDDSESVFTDSENISDYALEPVNCLCSAGVLNGMDDGNFKPLDNLTRSQAAAIVARVIK